LREGKPGIALVTGASRGIGAAIAEELARGGYDIWLNFRSNREAAEAVREKVEGSGRRCLLLPFDVADPAASKAALSPLLENDAPEVLVNNAGFALDSVMVFMTRQQWQGTLDAHLGGFFNVTQPVLMEMLKRKRGRIINIVSTSGQSGMAGQVNYSAAKAGLIGATKALAAEVGKRNVLVNAVSPGFIETDMTRDVPRDRVLPMIPLGRFGTPAEVAALVGFLCTAGAGYITGQVIAVNGGAYM